MKSGSIAAGRILLVLFVAGAAIALISWDHKQSTDRSQKQSYTDTVPKGKKTEREKKVRNLDEALDELDGVNIDLEMEKAMKEVQKALKEIDGEKIKRQIQDAMKEVDFEKIQKEIQESMGKVNIDMEKLQKEMKESFKELDGEKMKAEMEKAMKEVDFEKIQKEVKESMAKIDMEQLKKEMAQMKKIDMKELEEEMTKMKKEMEKIGPQIKEEMEKAKGEIEKAKTEIKEYKSFVDGLDKDGLIKKDAPYTIKHKDGELTINGKKASNETYLKYKSFLEKHTKFTIEKTDDDFDIDMD